MTRDEIRNKMPEYELHLKREEKSTLTVSKYLRDVGRFAERFSPDQEMTHSVVLKYKDMLIDNYCVTTCNSYLISVNKYLKWVGLGDCGVKLLKSQRSFSLESTLKKEEYYRILRAASSIDVKWYLIMRVLGGTGVRIGELPYLTAEAVNRGYLCIRKKGKTRQAMLGSELNESLRIYCRENEIAEGIVFFSSRARDKGISQSTIWRNLRKYAEVAGVDLKKVFPHNFRHMFAKVYMERFNNIVELADILGHNSIETTRIYVRTTQEEKIHQIDQMNL